LKSFPGGFRGVTPRQRGANLSSFTADLSGCAAFIHLSVGLVSTEVAWWATVCYWLVLNHQNILRLSLFSGLETAAKVREGHCLLSWVLISAQSVCYLPWPQSLK